MKEYDVIQVDGYKIALMEHESLSTLQFLNGGRIMHPKGSVLSFFGCIFYFGRKRLFIFLLLTMMYISD